MSLDERLSTSMQSLTIAQIIAVLLIIQNIFYENHLVYDSRSRF